MSLFIKLQTYFLFFYFSMFSTLYAEQKNIHVYDIESGIVHYEIVGGARLTKETNLTIRGASVLRFKKWGLSKIEEDEGIISTEGAIRSLQHIKRLEKHTEDSIITVDFEHQQLLERKRGNIISSFEKETQGLLQHGQEVIAGYPCEIWTGMGISKCLYKGILLKQESVVLGVSYVKVAKKAIFDVNITDDSCLLPNYPRQVFSLYKDRFKTKSLTGSKDVCKIFKDVVVEVDEKNRSYDTFTNLNDKKRKKFVNKIANSIFTSQKKRLPSILLVLKQTRECLHLSLDLPDVQQCIRTFNEKKSELGVLEDSYEVFTGSQTKEEMLDKIEELIIDLQARMPCVKRAMNITDLSHCME